MPWARTTTSAAAHPGGSSAPWGGRGGQPAADRHSYIRAFYQMQRPDYYHGHRGNTLAAPPTCREGKVDFMAPRRPSRVMSGGAQWAASQGGHHRFRSEQPPLTPS